MGKHQSTIDCDKIRKTPAASARTSPRGVVGGDEYVNFGQRKAVASVVLDFDCTISQTHVWFTLRQTGDGGVNADRIPRDMSVEQIFGSPARQQQLESVFAFLTAHNVQLIILTNNHKRVVDKCLSCVGWSKYIPDVIGRERPGTKGQIVAALRESLGASGGHWVFADDDQSNVTSVESANRGAVKTIFVDGGAGMKPQHLDELVRHCFPNGAPKGAPSAK